MTGCGSGRAAESSQPSADEALALLERALDLIDQLKLSPEIGARLNEVIDALAESN